MWPKPSTGRKVCAQVRLPAADRTDLGKLISGTETITEITCQKSNAGERMHPVKNEIFRKSDSNLFGAADLEGPV